MRPRYIQKLQKFSGAKFPNMVCQRKRIQVMNKSIGRVNDIVDILCIMQTL